MSLNKFDNIVDIMPNFVIIFHSNNMSKIFTDH